MANVNIFWQKYHKSILDSGAVRGPCNTKYTRSQSPNYNIDSWFLDISLSNSQKVVWWENNKCWIKRIWSGLMSFFCTIIETIRNVDVGCILKMPKCQSPSIYLSFLKIWWSRGRVSDFIFLVVVLMFLWLLSLPK